MVQRYREYRRRRKAEWEATCNHCGLCCYRKRYRRGRLIIDTAAPCPHLDTASGDCTVYENRFRVCLDCRKVTMYHALFSSLMPAECAYVAKYRKWRWLIPTPLIYRPEHRRS